MLLLLDEVDAVFFGKILAVTVHFFNNWKSSTFAVLLSTPRPTKAARYNLSTDGVEQGFIIANFDMEEVEVRSHWRTLPSDQVDPSIGIKKRLDKIILLEKWGRASNY